MALTANQMQSCLTTYWYMWLTNGISGLIFMGISLGIAAFFLKKHATKKAMPHEQAQSTAVTPRDVTSPSRVNLLDNSYNANLMGQYDPYNPDFNGQYAPNASMSLVANDLRDLTSADSTIGVLEKNEQFRNTTLLQINAARGRHNSSPVELNEQLSEIAQRWAEQMARTGKLEHSPAEWRYFDRQTLGETFTATFQVELTGEKMVKKWMKEGKRYMFGYDGRKDTENFTQLVWRSSQDIGVGRARSEDGNWWYGVVIYHPPGNLTGQYSQNVLLPAE